MNLSKDLVAASSTPMVLGVIREGETYGYEIVKRVAELSGGELEWTEGMLYPLLHRLEQQGLLTSRWHAAPDSNRRRKYYAITETGQHTLLQQQQQWLLITKALNKVWHDVNESMQGGNHEPQPI